MNAIRPAMLVGLCLLWTGPLHAQAFPSLLDPADPNRVGRPPHYASVTSGLKRFGVVEPKDWLKLNQAVGPRTSGPSGMKDMPGMGGPTGPASGRDQ